MLDPCHDTALLGPGFPAIARFGKARINRMAAFGTAHPDIIGLRLHEAVEHGIAGNAPVTEVDFAGRANGSPPPSSWKGEALSWIVTD